jgi:hypothetical protein
LQVLRKRRGKTLNRRIILKSYLARAADSSLPPGTPDVRQAEGALCALVVEAACCFSAVGGVHTACVFVLCSGGHQQHVKSKHVLILCLQLSAATVAAVLGQLPERALLPPQAIMHCSLLLHAALQACLCLLLATWRMMRWPSCCCTWGLAQTATRT